MYAAEAGRRICSLQARKSRPSHPLLVRYNLEVSSCASTRLQLLTVMSSKLLFDGSAAIFPLL